MKKFIILLMAFALVFSSVSGVFADEVEQLEETLENSELPIQNEEDTIMSKVLLKINKDGSVTHTVKEYIDDASYEQAKEQIELLNSMSEDGKKYAVGEDGSRKYIAAITETKAGEDFSIIGTGVQNGLFSVNKGLFGTEYFASLGSDDRVSMEETPLEDAVPYFQIEMELPYPASYNNATHSDNFNRKLTWNIYEGRINTVEVKFLAPNNFAISLLVVLAFLAIVLFIGIITGIVILIVLIRKKKATDAELIEDAMQHLEGETDQFVEDPFENMTDEEIQADIEAEEATEDVAEEIEEEIVDFIEEVVEETDNNENEQ